jgi:hypothetical protein
MAAGTPSDPWTLTTPPGRSDYTAYRDEAADPPALVVNVGSTELRYHLRCIEDLHAMLTEHGDWMALGNADEQKPAAEGTVEAWGRSPENPVGGWLRAEEGPARPLRQLRSAGPRGPRPRRGRAQRAQQPNAGALAQDTGTRSSTTASASATGPPPSRRATSVPSSYQRSETWWPHRERRRGSEALQRIGSWSGSPV